MAQTGRWEQEDSVDNHRQYRKKNGARSCKRCLKLKTHLDAGYTRRKLKHISSNEPSPKVVFLDLPTVLYSQCVMSLLTKAPMISLSDQLTM